MEIAERAGFPEARQCMACHQSVKRESAAIRDLAALPPEERPWSAKIYKVSDFVFFSHARHRTAKLACETCHGAVAAKDAVTREAVMNMKWCVDCHKARKATVVCTACHELSQ